MSIVSSSTEGFVQRSAANLPARYLFPVLCGVLVCVAATGAVLADQARREFSVSARKYAYTVTGSDQAEIRVQLNDLVRITFSAEDIPHSFTIDDDHYRISKRAEPGKATTIDFRADKAGTFVIYCNLMIDDRCRKDTRARFVVTDR
ncbi:MAG TPA: hypothetical protein VFO19_06150 [Vicinamibacterales bacterium]|nr:hypothetical protein [Vicinamibacterales bacterium]